MTPVQLTLGGPVVNSVGIVLVPIPADEFQMGSPESEADSLDIRPQHLSQITKPFYLSAHEVTQQQYEKVIGNNPSLDKWVNKPVEMVTWSDAVEFCRKLSEKEGVEYRLPMEAEWEYACRAGTTTAYSFGDDKSRLGKYAWYEDNSELETNVVGQKLPNTWGLYDMHGNVWEWCQDWDGPYEKERVISDPTGPASGEYRVLRGGAYIDQSVYIRSTYRLAILPDSRLDDLVGIRLARTYQLAP